MERVRNAGLRDRLKRVTRRVRDGAILIRFKGSGSELRQVVGPDDGIEVAPVIPEAMTQKRLSDRTCVALLDAETVDLLVAALRSRGLRLVRVHRGPVDHTYIVSGPGLSGTRLARTAGVLACGRPQKTGLFRLRSPLGSFAPRTDA